jgi:hypothetical protein
MAKQMTDSNNPTHEQITRRAYEIFIERGQPEGRDLDHWLEAERQLRSAGKPKNTAAITGASSASTAATAPVRGMQPAPTNGRSSNGRSTRPAAKK